jgi:hypothetical protein
MNLTAKYVNEVAECLFNVWWSRTYPNNPVPEWSSLSDSIKAHWYEPATNFIHAGNKTDL